MVRAQKNEEEITVGEFPVTGFKVIEEQYDKYLKCKAGPFDIFIDSKMRILVAGKIKGKEDEMIHWKGEGYSEKSFTFMTGKLEKPSDPRSWMEISLALDVRVEKYGLSLHVLSPRSEWFNSPVANKLDMETVKKAAQLYGKVDVRPLFGGEQPTESAMEVFRKIAGCENAVRQAASIAADVMKLREHPQVEVYRLYLKHIGNGRMASPSFG